MEGEDVKTDKKTEEINSLKFVDAYLSEEKPNSGDLIKKQNESVDSRTENLTSLDEGSSQEERLRNLNKSPGLSKGRLDLSNFDYLEYYKAWKNLKKIKIPKRKKKKKNNEAKDRTVEIYRDENYCTEGRYTDDEDFNYSNY